MAQPHPLPLDPPAEVIGHGLWGTLDDFVKFLQALLDGGGPILSQKSVDLLFLPEIFNAQSLEHAIQEDYKHLFGAYIPRGARIDHSIGGLLNLNDLPGRRRGGTLQVTGMPNTIWVSNLPFNIYLHLFLTLCESLSCLTKGTNHLNSSLTAKLASLRFHSSSFCQTVIQGPSRLPPNWRKLSTKHSGRIEVGAAVISRM